MDSPRSQAVRIAVREGDAEAARVLLQGGADANLVNWRDATLLHTAAKEGDIDTVRVLLEFKANPNLADVRGVTPLQAAAEAYHTADATAIVRALLLAGASVDQADERGQTALSAAVWCSNSSAVRALLDANASPNTADEDMKTPLFAAAVCDHLRRSHATHDIMRALVLAGADQKNPLGYMPCNAVARLARRGDTDAVCALLQRGAPVTGQLSWPSPLYEAAEAGRTDTARALLLAGASVHEVHRLHGTALHGAARGGHADTVRELLQAGADVEFAQSGATPLASAAKNGRGDAMRALAEAGADINTRDCDGRTPVWIAAQDGRTDAIRVLAELRADINARDRDGRTPVWIAAQDGRTDAIRVLAELRADLNAADSHGWTPLQTAIRISMTRKHTDTARALLDAGADPEAPFSCGLRPLAAAAAGRTDTVWMLARDYGADPRGLEQKRALAFAMLDLPDDVLRQILLPLSDPHAPHAVATRDGNEDTAALLAWLAELVDEPPAHAAANAAVRGGPCARCHDPLHEPVAAVPCGHCACRACWALVSGLHGRTQCFACATRVLLRVPAQAFPPQRRLR